MSQAYVQWQFFQCLKDIYACKSWSIYLTFYQERNYYVKQRYGWRYLSMGLKTKLKLKCENSENSLRQANDTIVIIKNFSCSPLAIYPMKQCERNFLLCLEKLSNIVSSVFVK